MIKSLLAHCMPKPVLKIGQIPLAILKSLREVEDLKTRYPIGPTILKTKSAYTSLAWPTNPN